MSNLNMGDTLYLFDSNRRVYPNVTDDEKKAGKIWPSGGPIYREHFRPLLIAGETPGTWVLEPGRLTVNKKTLKARRTAFGQECVYTKDQVDAKVYIHDNATRIAALVEHCHNVDLLKRIDKMLQVVSEESK